MAWRDGDAGAYLDATSGSCQHIHTVQQYHKINLQADCSFTSDSFCSAEARKNFPPPSYISSNKTAPNFPTQPSSGSNRSQDSVSWSHSATEDLSVAVPFTDSLIWQKKKFSPYVRGLGKLVPFLSSAEGFCLPALSLLFPLLCFLVLHRCRMTAKLLISDLVAHSVSCALCRY